MDCIRKLKKEQKLCTVHTRVVEKKENVAKSGVVVANGMIIGNTSLFNSEDIAEWEAEYQRVMDSKYKKDTRNFHPTTISLSRNYGAEPPIYLIPRERGGPSYKATQVEGAKNEDLAYCPISKGYSMQDVSSFTLGPIVGEGLCLVNAAFSKCIYTWHLEGGKVNLKRKSFWQSSGERHVVLKGKEIEVDGKSYEKYSWLKKNEKLWLAEWQKWRQSIAMASRGSFHWGGDDQPVAYFNQEEYIGFVEWKKKCYIGPAYDLLPHTRVYQYLEKTRNEGRPLGLVHPMAITGQAEKAITKEYLRNMYDDEFEHVCMPFVVAGKLLGVEID